MTWIKICGITNLEDALVAVEAGADALGFVFYEKSPRNIGLRAAHEIGLGSPRYVERIGIFVNTSLRDAFDIAAQAELTGAQIYGKESELSEQYRDLPNRSEKPKLILAVDGNDFAGPGGTQHQSSTWLISKGFADGLFAFLIDCGSGERLGGTGNRFDWTKARGAIKAMNKIKPTIVAGGLDPSNVVTAMTLLSPWGVDVSSGVEARPGKKDPEKVRAFIRAVREADKANSN